MTIRLAIGRALRDFYEHSWLLVLANATLGVVLVCLVLATLAFPPAVVLLVLAGPALAMVVHCAVTVVRTGELAVADAVTGLREHWVRGLELAFGGLVALLAGGFAVRFYGASEMWPMSFLALYVLLLLGVYQLLLWTLAVASPERTLAALAREAAVVLASRAGVLTALAGLLLVVNLAGLAAALMPFLTLTVAFTFLVTARFLLPATKEVD